MKKYKKSIRIPVVVVVELRMHTQLIKILGMNANRKRRGGDYYSSIFCSTL